MIADSNKANFKFTRDTVKKQGLHNIHTLHEFYHFKW